MWIYFVCVCVWRGGVWAAEKAQAVSCFASADVAPVTAGLPAHRLVSWALVQHSNAILWRRNEMQLEDENALTL